MGKQPKTVMKMVNADSGLSTVIWAVSVLTIPIKILASGGGKEHMHLQGNGGGGGRGELRVE